MRFAEFLRTTALISAGAATALAVAAIAAASGAGQTGVLVVLLCWWTLAAGTGAWLGRGARVSASIGRLLAGARAAQTLPELRPARVLLNRLWPLIVLTIVTGGLALIAPQVPGIAAGFAMLGALAWRRQEGAVTAIEERDGARFYVESTSPLRPMRLTRTPGFRAHFTPRDGYEKAEASP